jgi:GT2 family glycosyltransferase
MYVEDVDWCRRIRNLNYSIVYYPKLVVNYQGDRKARRSIKYALFFFKSLMRYWMKILKK